MAPRRTAGKVVSSPRYRTLAALSYDGRRVPVGEVRDDIPPQSVSWLLQRGHIERVVEEEGD